MKNYIMMLPMVWLLLSCGDDNENKPASPSCLITEVKDSASGNIKTSYEYNPSHRLTKINFFSSGSLSNYTSYTYSGSSMGWQNFTTDNVGGTLFSGTLNGDGNLQSYSTGQYPLPSGQTIAYSGSFAYSGDKKLISLTDRSVFRDASNTVVQTLIYKLIYSYTGGRVSKLVVADSDTATSGSIVYEYFYDESTPTVKYNPVMLSSYYDPSIVNVGILLADKIPVKVVLTATDGNDPQVTTSYFTATVNADGYPTKIRESISTNGSGVTSTYTKLYSYLCH